MGYTMKRLALQNLITRKSKPFRKPLIVLGVRQVGKTHLLKKFGTTYYKNTVYINFEMDQQLKSLFVENLRPARIVEALKLLGHSVEIGDTLLLFDEIQNCPEALTSLKYFSEDLPQLHIAAAGSLLGLFLNEASFPVGKVELENLFPMNFAEFLLSRDKQSLHDILLAYVEHKNPLSLSAHESLLKLFKEYLVVGGLPEVVAQFCSKTEPDAQSFDSARKLQSQLITSYLADVAKHSGKINSMHIERVWQQAAIQLSRAHDQSTEKFKFKDVVPKFKGYERLAGAIDWLQKSGLVLRIPLCHKVQTPLVA